MNIIQQLSLKSMRKNKTTTLVTVLGIIMSVALTTGLFLFSNSLLHYLRNDYIAQRGNVELFSPQITNQQVDSLPQRELIESEARIALRGVEAPNNEHVLPFTLFGLHPESLNAAIQLPLREGRLPEKPGEVVVTPEFLKQTDRVQGVGDSFDFDLAQPASFINFGDTLYQDDPNDLTLTVVGVLEKNPLEYPFLDANVFSYQTPEEIHQAKYVWAGFTLNRLNSQTALQFQKDLGPEGRITSLAEYSPGMPSRVRFFVQSFATVLLVIVALAGISLIQNGFLISLSQRMRELSLLSSVGMTRRQKWRMALTEGSLLFLIALPIGIAAGFIAMSILFQVLTPLLKRWLDSPTDLVIYWDAMTLLKISLASLATVILATIIPAMRTSFVAPLAGVRQQEEITIKPKELTSPTWVSKLFGIEGELAWKNLRRNRQRYRLTLISLLFSLVLYLSFASLMDYAGVSSDVALSRGKEDVIINSYGGDPLHNRLDFESLIETEGVESGIAVYKLFAWSDQLKGYASQLFSDERQVPVEILSFDAATMQQLLSRWKLRPEQLKGQAVFVNQVRLQAEDGAYRAIELFEHPPEQVEFHEGGSNPAGKQRLDIVKLEPDALTEYNSWNASVVLVVLPETLEELVATGSHPATSMELRINSKRSQHTEVVKRLEMSVEQKHFHANIQDNLKRYQRERDFLKIGKILFFGFATIMGMISLASIYNSIISSLRFRKKEFAMLRSVGMEEKSFRRMIRLESYMYAMKLLLYGIPLGILSSYVIFRYLMNVVQFRFRIPVLHYGVAIALVVGVLLLIMNLGSREVRQGNILDHLKMELDL